MVKIIRTCTEYFHIGEKMLYWDGIRGEVKAKSVTMNICCEVCGYSLKEIGDRFNISYMGVSAALRRVKDKKERNKRFKGRVNEIKSLL